MGAFARLSSSALDVQPGQTASLQLTVRNSGTVVDRFTFEMLAAPAAWTIVSPSTLSLFPAAEGTVTITFAPPRSASVAAGETPFAVRVSSNEDPAAGTVEEGTVNVGAFSDVSAELIPTSLRGRRSSAAELAVDNRSNLSYRAELSGVDSEMALDLRFRPPIIDAVPGQVAIAKVAVRPRRRYLRGSPVTRTFEIVLREDQAASMAALGEPIPTPTPSGLESAGWESTAPLSLPGARGSSATGTPSTHPAEVVVRGSMVQDPLLAGWPLKALAALLAVVLLAVILWFGLLRPQIRSSAGDAVTRQLAADGIAQATGRGGVVPGSVKGGSSSVTSGGGPGGLTVNGALVAAGNGTKAYTVPDGKTLQITDLIVQNSAGDVGTVALARDGAVLIQWSMANFRDLDYHWITPLVFGPGAQVQLTASGCTGACAPGIFYAGTLVPTRSR
ncbi:MAG: hypothetical protein M3063_16220 [Actinomycetota bacterium]|nr:hypothetical protein [Actinomycetota bacterium]